MRAVEAWLAASGCAFGSVFRTIDRWGSIKTAALHPYALPRVLALQLALAGIKAARLVIAAFVPFGALVSAGLLQRKEAALAAAAAGHGRVRWISSG